MISLTALKYLINSKIQNFYIKNIKVLSTENEYITCQVNDDYIFTVILNPKNTKSNDSLLDQIRPKLNIEIPKIEYLFTSDDVIIKGYKKIEGIPLNRNIFRLLTEEEQDKLVSDISDFLIQLHSSQSLETNKTEEMIKEIDYIKSNLFEILSQTEKNYINNFLEYISNQPPIIAKECISHNSLQYSRFIIKDNKLVGVVGFDDLATTPYYIDYIALLEDEEIGSKIIKKSNIDLELLKQYKDIFDRYYPIEVILYGIKNNRDDIIERGRRQIDIPIKKI